MKVITNRRRLVLKFLGSSVFVILGLLALLYGIFKFDILGAIVGLSCMFFLPIFIRSAFYFIKPKVVFTVEDGYIKSNQQTVAIDSLKGFHHYWRGSSSYLALIKKDNTEVEMELYNMVEPEDFSDELQKYIPYIEPVYEDSEEITFH